MAASGTVLAAAPTATTVDQSHPPGTRVFTGHAFDTCEAPGLPAMRAWRDSSPYRAIGVYIGGRDRACPQHELTPGWVRETSAMGWRLLPLYVGSQAPCVTGTHHRIGDRPWSQGRAEGRDAAARAAGFGLRPRSALYLDIEAYDIADTACADATLAFIRGWTREVRRHDFLPGLYSSVDSAVPAVERARLAGTPDMPEVLWFARWDVPAALGTEPALSRGAWPNRLLHQYRADVAETHGGVTLHIDRNLVDAPVAVVG